MDGWLSRRLEKIQNCKTNSRKRVGFYIPWIYHSKFPGIFKKKKKLPHPNRNDSSPVTNSPI